MKKLLSVLLALALMLPLCACAKTYTADEVADIKETAFDRGYSFGYDDGLYDGYTDSFERIDYDNIRERLDEASSKINGVMSVIEEYCAEDERPNVSSSRTGQQTFQEWAAEQRAKYETEAALCTDLSDAYRSLESALDLLNQISRIID